MKNDSNTFFRFFQLLTYSNPTYISHPFQNTVISQKSQEGSLKFLSFMVMHDKFIVTDALSAETIQDRAMILSQVEKEIFST